MDPKSKQNIYVLPFVIHSVSSEDPEFPAKNLLEPCHSSKGWQTQRFSSIPQQLIITLKQPCFVQSLQLLSHQYKISSKIEIFVGLQQQQGKEEPSFKKLGYFNLSSNENTQFKSRELKTVYIESPAQFFKFVFQKPHVNQMNFFSQISVIGLSFFGYELSSQSTKQSIQTPQYKESINIGLETKAQLDKNTIQLIENLEKEKLVAIASENFQRAKLVKEQIDNIKKISDQLTKLEQRKEVAISNEDFDAAQIIKEEINRLKAQFNIYMPKDQLLNLRENDDMVIQERKEIKNKQRSQTLQENIGQNEEQFVGKLQENLEERGMDFNKNKKKYQRRQEADEIQGKQEDLEDRPLNNNKFVNKKKQQDYVEDEEQITQAEPTQRNQLSRNQGAKTQQQQYQLEKSENKKIAQQINEGEFNREEERPLSTLKGSRDKKTQIEQTQEYQDQDLSDLGNNNNAKGIVSNKNKQRIIELNSNIHLEFLNEIFSSLFQQKQKALGDLKETISQMANKKQIIPNNIFSSSDYLNCSFSLFKLCMYLLEERSAQVYTCAFQTIEYLLKILNDKKLVKQFKQTEEFGGLMDLLFDNLQEKGSEFKNESLISMIENLISKLLLQFFTFDEIADRFIFSKTKKSKSFQSYKHIIGKLMIIQRTSKDVQKSKQSILKLMKYATDQLENSNKQVRDESRNLIVLFYKENKDEVLGFLNNSKVRKVHLDQLNSDFEKIESKETNTQEQNTNHLNKNQNRKQKPDEINNKQTVEEEENDQENMEEQNEQQNVSQVKTQSNQCPFCKRNDDKFQDQDYLDIHMFKNCLMLIQCNNCNQVVEIKDLNTHFLEECPSQDQYTKCPKCQQAIKNSEYEEHVEKLKCKMLKKNGQFVRCPLCEQDVVRNNEGGEDPWIHHLVKEGCLKNNRK